MLWKCEIKIGCEGLSFGCLITLQLLIQNKKSKHCYQWSIQTFKQLSFANPRSLTTHLLYRWVFLALQKMNILGKTPGTFIIWFQTKYRKHSPCRISLYQLLYFRFYCCWECSPGWYLHITQSPPESRLLAERWVSFPVTVSFTYLMLLSLIMDHSRSKAATRFFNHLLHQTFILSRGLLSTSDSTAIAVAVCKATEGKEHLPPWFWEGTRRTHHENIAMGEG